MFWIVVAPFHNDSVKDNDLSHISEIGCVIGVYDVLTIIEEEINELYKIDPFVAADEIMVDKNEKKSWYCTLTTIVNVNVIENK